MNKTVWMVLFLSLLASCAYRESDSGFPGPYAEEIARKGREFQKMHFSE